MKKLDKFKVEYITEYLKYCYEKTKYKNNNQVHLKSYNRKRILIKLYKDEERKIIIDDLYLKSIKNNIIYYELQILIDIQPTDALKFKSKEIKDGKFSNNEMIKFNLKKE